MALLFFYFKPKVYIGDIKIDLKEVPYEWVGWIHVSQVPSITSRFVDRTLSLDRSFDLLNTGNYDYK
jgi:hypothetical protein